MSSPALSRRGPISLIFLTTFCLTGCSKEELTAAVDKAKDKASEIAAPVAETIEDALPETGSVTLTMSPPAAEMKQANLDVITVGDGRPNVVQLVTYKPGASSRTFPCMMLYANTSATQVEDLDGEIQCDLFFQSDANSAVAMTPPGKPVTVSLGIINNEERTMEATIGEATLITADGKSIELTRGSVVAVIGGGK